MMPSLVGGAALVVGTLLLTSSANKVRSLATFREQIADYQIVRYPLSRVVAIVLIVWEAAGGVFLALPPTRQVGAFVTLPLMVMFVSVLGVTWIKGRHISCGCFGGGGELDNVGLHSLVRTIILLALTIVASLPWRSPFTTTEVLFALYFGLIVFLSSELARLLADLRQSLNAVRTAP